MTNVKNNESAAIASLTNHLENTLDITNMFVKMLQEEMVINASFRGKVDQSLSNLEDSLETIQEVVIEGNGHSLVSKIEKLEYIVEQIEDNILSIKTQFLAASDDKRAHEAKKTERFWNIVATNSPVILTWLGVGGWLLFQFFAKKVEVLP
jgi:hypothetical protein